MKFDFLIVGAGFAGATMAERIAGRLNKKVLIIEKRNNIGGNSYDCYDSTGILVHKYGPHIFRTDKRSVWDYLSQFTDWYHYEHKVLGDIDGKKVPIPFNLNTLHALCPDEEATRLENMLVSAFGYGTKVPVLKLKGSENENMKKLGEFIYSKIYYNYTIKQWGMKPEELDPSVTGRVPVYISRDDRYFQDAYQGIPKEGYTRLFQRMLDNSNIKIMFNTDFKEVISAMDQKVYFFGEEFRGKLFFTGKIDELFGYEFGELPYRSLKFEFENLGREYFQEAGVVNYPNDYEFTRITEFKHITGQRHFSTTIAREYPQPYDREIVGRDIPYYPIPRKENWEMYMRYKEKAEKYKNLILIGRLAEYRYYQMDHVVERALGVFENQLL